VGDVEGSNPSQEHRSIAQLARQISLPFSQVPRSACASQYFCYHVLAVEL
jgi:hypothetical protein